MLFLVLAIYADVNAQSRKSLLTQIRKQQSEVVRNERYNVPISQLKNALKPYFKENRYGLIEDSPAKMRFATNILSQYLVPRKETELNSRSKSTRKIVSCGQTIFVEVHLQTDSIGTKLTTEIIMGKYADARAYQYTRYDGEVPFNEDDLLLSLYTEIYGTLPPVTEDLAGRINRFNGGKVSESKKILKGRNF